ncbi:hypothetical protein [Thalassospira alkalitolerans]|uniref:hypothetical protein n=1 Tax=Thalassospira alkalitolerans TaxID=1293890 RepID=UPI001FE9D12A|nr:hypothetical protein [Thalassospira alkalitolerans]
MGKQNIQDVIRKPHTYRQGENDQPTIGTKSPLAFMAQQRNQKNALNQPND